MTLLRAALGSLTLCLLQSCASAPPLTVSERTERVPATVWQGVLWKHTQRHEMRMQHRVAARHFVPVAQPGSASTLCTRCYSEVRR